MSTGSFPDGGTPSLPASTGISPENVGLNVPVLDRILEEFHGQREAVIPILQRTQDALGYLPREALRYLAQKSLIPLNRLYGVATFYAQFRLTRRGRNLVRVCDGTACHVRGAPKNISAIERTLGLGAGSTSADYRYTFEIVYCLGSCGLAPVALVNGKVCGRLGTEALLSRLQTLS